MRNAITPFFAQIGIVDLSSSMRTLNISDIVECGVSATGNFFRTNELTTSTIRSENGILNKFPELQQILINETNNYLEHLSKIYADGLLKNKKVKIKDSWINITKSGGVTLPHRHPNSILSGVFYIKNYKSKLVFTNPISAQAYQLGYENIEMYPKSNELFIFPSYLIHHTTPNESDKDKVCVVFDTVWDE